MRGVQTLAVTFGCVLLTGAAWADNLDAGFAHPPQDARVRCFWWWLNGNVTKEAITRDLEEMAAKGFGGALIFDAGSSSYKTVTAVPAGPMYGSPEWHDLFRHALAEASRLGLRLSLNIQSGWNLGGPCVTAEDAAKQVVFSETAVSGPRPDGVTLPLPSIREGYYRDIAVVAYSNRPVEESVSSYVSSASSEQAKHDSSLAVDAAPETFWVSGGEQPGQGPSRESPEWLQIEFDAPVTVAGAEVLGRKGYGPAFCKIEGAGKDGAFTRLGRFGVKDGKPAVERFGPFTSLEFRLVIESSYDPIHPDGPRNVQVADWVLLGQDGNPVEPMRRGRPVRDLALKAGFHELGGSAPDCRFLLEDLPDTPGEEHARATEVVDLTGFLRDGGHLGWAVPDGDWTVLRFGYTLTEARVSTSSGDWQGAVLDYMNTPALQAYWDRAVQPLLDDAGALAGTTLQYLHTDSWECGGMNWTPGFAEEFHARRGYEILPYLPILAGKIIESRSVSNQFLADFRKTVADCVATNHYAPFAEMAHARGLEVHPESGGPHAGPLDGVRTLGLSDMPMGEFWVPSPHRPRPEDRFFVKQAASAAHIYGKQFVAAEAFTSIGPHWEDTLWRSVKPSFDHEACAGLNLSFLHTFTCSPAEMGMPGQEYFAGTHFNPNVTWWETTAGAVISYLDRCQFLLQQGQFIADICYYYGDHVPNIGQRKEADPAHVLPGHDYDVISEEILVHQLECKDGALVLPGGMRYRMLVLPDHGILSPAVIEKVGALLRAGATVNGVKPRHAATLSGGTEGRARFQALANEIWGEDQADTGQRKVGAGRIVWGIAAHEILEKDGLPHDCAWDGEDNIFGWIHRQAEGADIYFVSNRNETPAHATFVFRVTGKQPELWDPLTGTIRNAKQYEATGDTTAVPLEFNPYGALFVVFRHPAEEAGGAGNFPHYRSEFALDGPWTVAFDPRWGGPASAEFETLVSWPERPEEGIRFYSGAATYHKRFDMPAALQESCDTSWAIDLGEMAETATIRLNGKNLGVLWTPPFRAATEDALKAGENDLEITVVNNWPNRLIGDAGLPQEARLTRTNVTKFTAETPLTRAGLLGPVCVMREE